MVPRASGLLLGQALSPCVVLPLVTSTCPNWPFQYPGPGEASTNTEMTRRAAGGVAASGSWGDTYTEPGCLHPLWGPGPGLPPPLLPHRGP